MQQDSTSSDAREAAVDYATRTAASVSGHAAAAKKMEIARNSLLIALFLIVAKLLVGYLTDSLAILSQAADSAFDLAALFVTMLSIRISAEPPDEDHLYGHGKFENLSALLQAILLLGVTAYLGYQAILRLTSEVPAVVRVTIWSFLVLIVSIILDLYRAKKLYAAGKEHRSQALEASALNFLGDIFGALVALTGLVIVKITGYSLADAWAAIGVTAFVGFLSVRLAIRAIDGLTDRFPLKHEYARLRWAIERTSGVQSLKRLRVRQSGPVAFVEASIVLNRVLPFAEVSKIVQLVESNVHEIMPDSDVTIDWDAIRTDQESVFDTVKIITGNMGMLPHNLELSRKEDGLMLLDFHIEFPTGTDLKTAHDAAEAIEEKIRLQLPEIAETTIHLEVERSDKGVQDIRDVTTSRASFVEEIERHARNANKEVRDVRGIALIESSANRDLKLILTLLLDDTISLEAAHEVVTNVEDELHKRFPELVRIVAHSEPLTST